MPRSQRTHRQVLGSGEGSLRPSGRLFDASRRGFEGFRRSLKRWTGIPWSHRKSRPTNTAAARACALAVVRRVFEEDAWADRALHGEARRRGLDRATARSPRGWPTAPSSARPRWTRSPRSSPAGPSSGSIRPSCAALRLGLYQLAFLDRVPAHAVVADAVELVKAESPGGAKLVNAVLRRAAPLAAGWVAALPDDTPAQAALRHSYPSWIAALWFRALGPEDARALMAALNEPAEAVLRANTLRTDAGGARGAPRRPVAPAPGLPEGLVLDAPFDAFDSPLWAEGLFMPQSRAAMARGAHARAAAGRARARPVRRPGRQDHAPRRADGEPRRARRRRAPSGPRRRPAPHGGAHGRRGSTSAPATRPPSPPPSPSTACSSTRRAPTSARSPPAPTPAGASRPTCRSGSHACSRRSCAQARARRAPEAPSCTRPARSRPPRTPPWSRVSSPTSRASSRRDLRSDMPLWDDPRVPGFSQSLPHRDGTEGFFIARLRRRDAG